MLAGPTINTEQMFGLAEQDTRMKQVGLLMRLGKNCSYLVVARPFDAQMIWIGVLERFLPVLSFRQGWPWILKLQKTFPARPCRLPAMAI